MKYAIIKDYQEQHSKALMCRVMGVSRSGYSEWCKRPICDRNKRRQLMSAKVLETYEEFEAAYGSRRIAKELNDAGYSCSENYIANIMKDQGVRARNGKGFKYSRHSLTMVNVSENLLWRDFSAKGPNEKWTTDITYFSRLKVELIYAKNYQSMDEARTGIFAYIEVFYNRKRRHSAIGNISPIEFEERTALAA
ncbi:MAG: IS3 family transposase [Methylotenera sp.]